MTQARVQEISVLELVERFARIALDQDEALFSGEIARFNALYDKMEIVGNELKSRAGDQRSSLLPLYDHPNIQVRLQAAFAIMDIVPAAARQVFQKIADSHRYPQAADALGALRRLDGKSPIQN
jgi:hypothetical protein